MRIQTVLLILLATAILRQSPVASPQSTSIIRGRIADDLTHEAVSTVRITLTGTGVKDPVVLTSGADGNFQFPGLAEGRYSLALDKAGYLPQNQPDVIVPAAVTSNSAVLLGEISMTAHRTMSGTVKWDDGEPVTDAIVHVMSFRAGDLSRVNATQQVNTNARGEFKIEGARARRYVIFAYQRPQVTRPGGVVRVALPVFHPGTNRPQDAQALDMMVTKEVSGISLVMKEERGVAIEGTVTADKIPAGANVQIGIAIPGLSAPFLISMQAKVGEPFRLYPVPPGSYLLLALGSEPAPQPQGGVAQPQVTATPNTAPNPQAAQQLIRVNNSTPSTPTVAAVPVTVKREEGIRGLSVHFPAATPFEGKFERDDATQGQPSRIVPATNVGVMFEWFPKMELQYGLVSSSVNDKGEFRVSGVANNQAYIAGPGSSWGGAYVASFKQGQKDLMNGGLPAVTGEGPIHVLVKRDGGRLEGKVTDGGKAPWRAFVAVAPRDRRIEFWFRTAFTMSDGSFSIANIPPGEFDVFAFERNEDDVYYNAEFLRRYAAGSKPIQVLPYSSQSINLTLIKTVR